MGRSNRGIMDFHDMPYERITYEEIAKRYERLMDKLRTLSKKEDVLEVLKEHQLLGEDMTPMELCYVRHDMDVNDEFYAREQQYYDEIGPSITGLSNQFYELLLKSPYRSELEAVLGKQVLLMMEAGQKGFDSRVIPLAREENELTNRHNQLVSNLQVTWNGKQVKSTLLAAETVSKDRETRKRASLALAGAWTGIREEMETLYDRLVKNRDAQAKKLGFPDYVGLSYYRMNRIGYGPEEVGRFRELVKRYLTPFLERLNEQRRQRLGLERLHFYDNGVYFPEGNPKPQGDTAACLDATRKMYTGLSPETAEFIAYLLDNHLYDVEIRDGKRGGGYMLTFEKYRSPFIFANFDGTSENAYVMCHEGGHAFQGYLRRDEEFRERCWYTSEAAETHAMAMEFFMYPYMKLFFGDRAQDYCIMHLEGAVDLIARECQQDEFQQCIYERPDMTPAERNALWEKLDREYFPFRDYTGNEYLQQGCGWQRIPHIYQWPFYAIDYALAEVCALEYYRFMEEDQEGAWQSYLSFCRQTGSMSFPELVQAAGLPGLFEEETMGNLAAWLEKQLSLITGME